VVVPVSAGPVGAAEGHGGQVVQQQEHSPAGGAGRRAAGALRHHEAPGGGAGLHAGEPAPTAAQRQGPDTGQEDHRPAPVEGGGPDPM